MYVYVHGPRIPRVTSISRLFRHPTIAMAFDSTTKKEDKKEDKHYRHVISMKEEDGPVVAFSTNTHLYYDIYEGKAEAKDKSEIGEIVREWAKAQWDYPVERSGAGRKCKYTMMNDYPDLMKGAFLEQVGVTQRYPGDWYEGGTRIYGRVPSIEKDVWRIGYVNKPKETPMEWIYNFEGCTEKETQPMSLVPFTFGTGGSKQYIKDTIAMYDLHDDAIGKIMFENYLEEHEP